jgi:hypothetical protein
MICSVRYNLRPGKETPSYYYVRVIQKDGQMG